MFMFDGSQHNCVFLNTFQQFCAICSCVVGKGENKNLSVQHASQSHANFDMFHWSSGGCGFNSLKRLRNFLSSINSLTVVTTEH